MKFWAFAFFLLNSFFVGAQDDIELGPKKYLVLNPVQSSIALNDIDKRQIEKIMLKSCTKQTLFQVSMGAIGVATEAKLDVSHVSLVLEGKEQDLQITATLIDENKKILLGKVRKSHVKKQDMLRTIEDTVEELFRMKPSASNP